MSVRCSARLSSATTLSFARQGEAAASVAATRSSQEQEPLRIDHSIRIPNSLSPPRPFAPPARYLCARRIQSGA
jgi:hypothetical protein